MYWPKVVLPIHIFKLGARDISVYLRHYDVVLFLEYTLPYMIGKGDNCRVIYVDVNNGRIDDNFHNNGSKDDNFH